MQVVIGPGRQFACTVSQGIIIIVVTTSYTHAHGLPGNKGGCCSVLECATLLVIKRHRGTGKRMPCPILTVQRCMG